MDLTILEVDQLDRDTLACLIGQNPASTLPVQPPVPRIRQLVSQTEQLVALVSDPSKVSMPMSCSAGTKPTHGMFPRRAYHWPFRSTKPF